MSKIAEGDNSALADLYQRSSRLVYGLVVRILKEHTATEEVTLDVFTQVWRQARSFDSGRGSVMAWLLTIARTRAIDRLRSGKQDRTRSEPLDLVETAKASTGDPEEDSAISEQRRIVKAALALLSPEQREVLELAYYQGLSHSEIAARLGQPLGTVKTRTRLGMARLREALGPVLKGVYAD